MVVLGIFFFTAFLALFVVAAAALGSGCGGCAVKCANPRKRPRENIVSLKMRKLSKKRKADDVNAAKKPDEQNTKDKKGNKNSKLE